MVTQHNSFRGACHGDWAMGAAGNSVTSHVLDSIA